MPSIDNPTLLSGSKDLLSEASQPSDALNPENSREESETSEYSTGILPSQELEYQVKVSKEIVGLEPIQDDQYQPASLDLRLGHVAYRVRASFLPGKDAKVQDRLKDLAMHKMDITNGG